MPDVTLTAEPRHRARVRSPPAGLRAGKVPSIVYGLDTDPKAVTGRPAGNLERILHFDGLLEHA